MPLKQQQLGNIKDTKLLNIDDSVPENMFTVTHTHTPVKLWNCVAPGIA